MMGSWGVLAITLTIQALVSMAVLAVPAMAPALARVLHTSPSLLGAYIAILYVGAILASMVSGPLVRRWGAVRVSQAGLLACATGLAILALWPSIPGAILGAFITGLGYGPITPASSHILARTTAPHRVGLVFSIKQTGVPLGGVMAGALVPPIVLAGGVAAALWSVSVGCMVCLLAAEPWRSSLDADRNPAERIGIAHLASPIMLVARDPALSRLALYSLTFSTMQMCLGAYVVTFLTADLGYSLLAAGAALSIAQAGGIVGRILWGYVADRWFGAKRMLAVVAAIMTLCALGAAGLNADVPKFVVLTLLVVFGATAIGWNGVYLAEVARLAPPGMASAATGGSLAITFVGILFGPPLFGAIAQASGSYRAAFLAMAVPAGWSAWQLLRRPAPQP